MERIFDENAVVVALSVVLLRNGCPNMIALTDCLSSGVHTPSAKVVIVFSVLLTVGCNKAAEEEERKKAQAEYKKREEKEKLLAGKWLVAYEVDEVKLRDHLTKQKLSKAVLAIKKFRIVSEIKSLPPIMLRFDSNGKLHQLDGATGKPIAFTSGPWGQSVAVKPEDDKFDWSVESVNEKEVTVKFTKGPAGMREGRLFLTLIDEDSFRFRVGGSQSFIEHQFVKKPILFKRVKSDQK